MLAIKNPTFQDFESLYQSLEELGKPEADFSQEPVNVEAFVQWLQDHGIQTPGLTIKWTENAGYGIFTDRAIKEGDIMACIPASIMLTSDAKSSPLGCFCSCSTIYCSGSPPQCCS